MFSGGRGKRIDLTSFAVFAYGGRNNNALGG